MTDEGLIKEGEKMKIRFLYFLIAVCMFFSACVLNKPKCTVEIVTSYSGYGIDGQYLGSGTFSESFTVSAGDIFYEDYEGEWILNPDDNSKYGEIIAEVTEINDSGAVIVIHGESHMIKYGTGRKVQGMIIDDGYTYEYVLNVSEYKE